MFFFQNSVILLTGGIDMSDFAYDYFNSELDKLPLPELNRIFEKVKKLISQKTKDETVPFTRELGGFEEGFYMAPDFNETPDCFKEYM